MKMLQQNKNHIVYIILFAVLSNTINNGHSVDAQGPILGRDQDYGSTNSGGNVNVGSNAGVGSGSVISGSGGGEVIAPRSPPLSSHEPSCEELRAMWRFSKRQSRAAEITNEIPTYRDPFEYNVWDLYYPTTRSLGGMRINSRFKDASRPVYGRVLHNEPVVRFREQPERNRGFEDVSRIYVSENKGVDVASTQPRRRLFQFRFSGGSNAAQNSLTPQRGSFQRLKELIWTERARELAQQRKAEEMAARAAVLKEIANGQSYSPSPAYRQQMQYQSSLDDSYNNRKMEQQFQEEQQQQQQQKKEIIEMLPFPDLLQPTSKLSDTDDKISRTLGTLNDQQITNIKNSYNKYNDDNLSSILSPSYHMRPQPQSHFRERNRAVSRHSLEKDTKKVSKRRE